jgi:NAD(P)H-hydrate epimerase
MERAAGRIFRWFTERFDRSGKIFIFAGPGNNGGDGLALARMLARERYNSELWYVKFTDKTSDEWKVNYARLQKESPDIIRVLTHESQFPMISGDDIIIDALFGTGLTRPAEGLAARVIALMNDNDAYRISVDVPSGLFCEDNTLNNPDYIVKADQTLSFQFPRLAFMFAENEQYTGNWEILPIGLDDRIISSTETPFRFVSETNVLLRMKYRKRFDHKGVFGHGLLVSGSSGKMGAAILGSRAAMRSGIGLLTCHVPISGRSVLNSSVPEAMVQPDKSEDLISDIDLPVNYTAAAIGPGMGTSIETQKALQKFLKKFGNPVVVDADALNILSENKKWYSMFHAGYILTPHPKEFERLAGKSKNSYERLEKQIKFSIRHNCTIVLKGAFTSISTPQGDVYFNSTGNPGMATAGSGDVLTGIILSLLAQGYAPENAAITGVYLHGLAGDIAAEQYGYEAMIASDIINNLGAAYKRIRGEHYGDEKEVDI